MSFTLPSLHPYSHTSFLLVVVVRTPSEDKADDRIARAENDDPVIDVVGLRKMYDWVQQDAGKTVVMSGIQTVGAKSWE